MKGVGDGNSAKKRNSVAPSWIIRMRNIKKKKEKGKEKKPLLLLKFLTYGK